jgi:hypothetical protein
MLRARFARTQHTVPILSTALKKGSHVKTFSCYELIIG